jgi:hypothetical protein
MVIWQNYIILVAGLFVWMASFWGQASLSKLHHSGGKLAWQNDIIASYFQCKRKIMSLRCQASLAK